VFGDAGAVDHDPGLPAGAVPPAGPSYDQLPLPEFELIRRPRGGREGAQPGAGR
jgi:hypothetical protein